MRENLRHYVVRGTPPGIVATLLTRADEGPMRLITNGRQRKPVGDYYSLKNGFSVPWESRNELHAFYHAEVRSDVIGYRAQPHRLQLTTPAGSFVYTPDREDRLANGRTEIVEIKDAFEAERDPDYTSKLALAQCAYERLGWSFRLLERREIEAEPRFTTVERVQSYRQTAVTAQDVLAVMRLFQMNGQRTLGETTALFQSPVLGMAKVYAMTVRRILTVDLDTHLEDETPVRLVEREGGRHDHRHR